MTAIQWVGGVPISQIFWEDFVNRQDAIVELCLKKEKPGTIESGVGVPIKSNLWESTFDFLQDESLADLNAWIHRATTDFISSINRVNHCIAITESWAHITRPLGFHGPHRHPWSAWSGIFYVYADSPNITSNTFFNHYTMPKISGYEFFEEEFDIPFIPGSLVIFPSTMMHYAKPYLGNDKRIVIAFNAICC